MCPKLRAGIFTASGVRGSQTTNGLTVNVKAQGFVRVAEAGGHGQQEEQHNLPNTSNGRNSKQIPP